MNTFAAMLVVQASLFFLVVIWVRARLKRFLDSDETVDRARKDVGSLLVELDGTTDRNVTILEAKLSELKDMIAEADRRISLLARDKPPVSAPPVAYDRHGQATRQAGPARREPAVAGTGVNGPAQGSGDTISISGAGAPNGKKTADYAYSAAPPPAAATRRAPGETAQAAQGEDSGKVPFIRFSSRPIPVDEPFPDRVMSLFRKGMSADMIASALGANAAEVEIVIAMEEGRNRGT